MRIAVFAVGAVVAGYLGLLAIPGARSPAATPFPSDGPLVLAHRGGMGLWPENTLHGYRAALALGVDVLEIDARRSADGQLVAFHDVELGRTTNGRGPLAARTLAELSRLDAGHGFSRDGGASFPFRGRGLRIPTLAEVFRALPGARLSIELKDDAHDVAETLCALVEQHDAAGRVLVASFHQGPVDTFRERCPRVGTAATAREALRFYLASRLGLPNLLRPRAAVLFVSEWVGPFQTVTEGLVAHASELNLPVYVWGVETRKTARRLLDAGVAGLTTDRPDRMLSLLGRSSAADREDVLDLDASAF